MKIKEVLLGIIIGVVLLMFLVFGTKLIYEVPDYGKYCSSEDVSQVKINDSSPSQNSYEECYREYDDARGHYSARLFVLSLILGILLIVGAAMFIETSSVSGGIMFGSIMFVIYGTSGYWEYMDDWVRFGISGIALAVLIYVGYLMKRKEKRKTRQ